ncbi:hypothetical protein O5853_30420, partial [Escherichia coli]|nr:hypothetical protein [Escherichia coli]
LGLQLPGILETSLMAAEIDPNVEIECWIFEGGGKIGRYVGGYHDARGQQEQYVALKHISSAISPFPCAQDNAGHGRNAPHAASDAF